MPKMGGDTGGPGENSRIRLGARGMYRGFSQGQCLFDRPEGLRNDNSSEKRLAKDEAKEETVESMRDFDNTFIRFNKKMDDPAKLMMGIALKGTKPKFHGTPVSQPDTVVENTINHFEHKVKAVNRETGCGGKPPDAYEVSYAWQVDGEKLAFAAGFGQNEIKPEVLPDIPHIEVDKGKPAYYGTCYENSRDDPGPWSPIEEAFIG